MGKVGEPIKTYLFKWRNKLKKLKVQLYLGYFLTFLMISGVMAAVIYCGVKQMVTDQIGLSRVEVLNQISERSNTIKNATLTISSLYCYDPVVKVQLEGNTGEIGEAGEAGEAGESGESGEAESTGTTGNFEDPGRYLEQLRDNYQKVFRDVGLSYEVVMIGENGFRYSSAAGQEYDFSGLEKQLWFKKAYDSGEELVFISSFQDSFYREGDEKEPYVFRALRKVTDDRGAPLGAIVVNVEEKYLEHLYTSASEGKSKIYIFDNEGRIVSSRDKSLLGIRYIGVENFRNLYGEKQYHVIKKLGEDYLLSYCYDRQTGWTIVEEIPCPIIFSPLYDSLKVLMAAFGVCMVTALGVSGYMAARISGPITQLCRSMDLVKQGDFGVISRIKGYEEANQLGESFNDMAGEIKHLMENIRQREINKKRIEMDFLRAQINPHFLYNTLFSIQCMTELGKNDQAVSMMSAFINLLKRTLSVDTDFITLEEEFENTKRYLVLQQIRYGSQVHFECEPEEAAKTCLVPSLIIQPIVENAIFHGIEAKEKGGFIIVEAGIEQGKLLITVSDDGPGLREDQVAGLRKGLECAEYRQEKSIGMINVSNRIRMNFGEEYGVEIASEQGVGTTVTLSFPVLREKNRQYGEGFHENIDCG